MSKVVFVAILAVSLLIMGCPQTTTTIVHDDGALLILQVYGNGPLTGGSPAGISHSFIELFNSTNRAINLTGFGLYWANGTDLNTIGVGEEIPNRDGEWARICLDGQVIPAHGSFLVLGAVHPNLTNTRFIMEDDSGDLHIDTLVLSRRGFKVALLQSRVNLNDPDIQNPFDIDGEGTRIEGYIDMVGTANEWAGPFGAGGRDLIFGFEFEPARNSASEAARRQDLNDSNDNAYDFIAARYARDGMTDDELELRHPRSSRAGRWNPFVPFLILPPPVADGLMILQANTFGNANGGGGGFARSLVELYNNTDTSIDLNAGNYYLHLGNQNGWTNVIKLHGIIPARSSFLVVSNTSPTVTGGAGNFNATPRALLPDADQYADFVFTNDAVKVVLLRNQSALLSSNPFTDPRLRDYYVDMLGAGDNLAISETARAEQSRPRSPRRVSLVDTNNNSADFAQADFRGLADGNGMPNDELYRFWPRNASQPWNPMTGYPPVHPILVQ